VEKKILNFLGEEVKKRYESVEHGLFDEPTMRAIIEERRQIFEKLIDNLTRELLFLEKRLKGRKRAKPEELTPRESAISARYMRVLGALTILSPFLEDFKVIKERLEGKEYRGPYEEYVRELEARGFTVKVHRSTPYDQGSIWADKRVGEHRLSIIAGVLDGVLEFYINAPNIAEIHRDFKEVLRRVDEIEKSLREKIEISKEEVEKVCRGELLKELGENANVVLELVHEQLRRRGIEVPSDVENAIANLVILIARKIPTRNP
jgi:hypothetical protein